MSSIICFGNVRISGTNKKLVTSYAALGIGLAIVFTVGLTAISNVVEQPSETQFKLTQPEPKTTPAPAMLPPVAEKAAKPLAPPSPSPSPAPGPEKSEIASPTLQEKYAEVDIESGSSNAGDNKGFAPKVAQIAVGDTVAWTNDDAAGHTVTSGKLGGNDTGSIFDSTKDPSGFLIKPTKSWSHTFDKAGSFPYFDQAHPWMTGTIIVGAAYPSASPATAPVPAAPSPPSERQGKATGESAYTASSGAKPGEAVIQKAPAAKEEAKSYYVTEAPTSPFAGLVVVLPYIAAAIVGSVVFVVTRKRVGW